MLLTRGCDWLGRRCAAGGGGERDRPARQPAGHPETGGGGARAGEPRAAPGGNAARTPLHCFTTSENRRTTHLVKTDVPPT
eukprot:1623868-Pyramimonas_sp.AAC.1